MAQQNSGWSDERVERILGTLLRAGVIIAALVVLAGGVLFLVRHGGEPADHRVFQGEPADYRTLTGIVVAALSGTGRGIIQLGLLLLIATPVARVLFSVIAFARQRDHIYVVLTLIVLAVLLGGLFLGPL
jgi:uncharacterized membrane protein